jgi:hypothetical protein
MFCAAFHGAHARAEPEQHGAAGEGIDYTLLLMGDLFAEGKTNEPFVPPALGGRNST